MHLLVGFQITLDADCHIQRLLGLFGLAACNCGLPPLWPFFRRRLRSMLQWNFNTVENSDALSSIMLQKTMLINVGRAP